MQDFLGFLSNSSFLLTNTVKGSPDIVFPHLNISFDTVNRFAFNLFGLKAYWYGVIITFGIFLALMIAMWNTKRVGSESDLWIDFAIFAVPLSIVGARIYYIIFSWDTYKDNLSKVFAFRDGGLAILGGVIVAVLCAYIFTKFKKMSFLKFTDIGIMSLILGQAIGRWGNFFNREAFGEYTDSLFAMQLKVTEVDITTITPKMLQNLVVTNATEYIQVHPTFLYESAWCIFAFAVMMIWFRHKKHDGEILSMYLMFYGLGRFFIEGLRTDQLMLLNTEIPVSQFVSAVMFIGGAALLVYLYFVRKQPILDSRLELYPKNKDSVTNTVSEDSVVEDVENNNSEKEE